MNKPPNILVSRTDRLGDVLLSLPSLLYLRSALPESEIDFMCRHDYEPVVGSTLSESGISTLPYGKEFPKVLSARKYDAVLTLFGDPKVMLACARARIPLRVGTRSKLISLWALHHGIFQRRSKGLKHEAEYNLELAKKLVKLVSGKPPEFDLPRIRLKEDPAAKDLAKVALSNLGIDGCDPFLVLHPGMGKSAVNLSVKSYLELLNQLSKDLGMPIVLSIGPSSCDQKMGEEILRAQETLKVIRGFSLSVLMEVFRRAHCVVAPSTGPLHLAHFVGTRTLGLYSPVRSHHPRRWAPWGGTGESLTISPEVDCPAKQSCLGSKCAHYLCMDQLPRHERVLTISRSLPQRGIAWMTQF